MRRVITLSAWTIAECEEAHDELIRLFQEQSGGRVTMPTILAESATAAENSRFSYHFHTTAIGRASQNFHLIRALVAFRKTCIINVRLYLHYMTSDNKAEMVFVWSGTRPTSPIGQTYIDAALSGSLTLGVPLNDSGPDLVVADAPPVTKPTSSAAFSPDVDEDVLQMLYKASVRMTFGHKPWGADGDATLFAMRCICRINDAVMVAEPCEHLALCPTCYADMLKANEAFLQRCPKCAMGTTRFHHLDDH